MTNLTAFQANQNAMADKMEREDLARDAAEFGPGYRETFYWTGNGWSASHGNAWTRRAGLDGLKTLVRKLYGTGTLKRTRVIVGRTDKTAPSFRGMARCPRNGQMWPTIEAFAVIAA